jgi:beta-N-acetylhexosaminidase
MTSHIVVPALDPERPATLSPVVLGVLRDRLGHRGVVVSDALDMAGASDGRGIREAAVLALAAGCDLLCLGPDKPASLVEEVRDAVVAAVHGGRLGADRLVEAAARVATIRDGLSAGAPGAPDDEWLLRAATSALLVEGDLPDLAGAAVVSVETTANIAVGAVAWGIQPDVRLDPTGGPGLPGDGAVVVQVRDAHRHPEVLAILDGLEASGRPAVVVEWGWPGPYDGGLARICTRGSSGPGVAAVVEVLREAGWRR